MRIDKPKNRKELRSFIGIINYYRDMWIGRSHVLAPLATLTSKTTKWNWGPQQAKAFATAKRIIAEEVMLVGRNTVCMGNGSTLDPGATTTNKE